MNGGQATISTSAGQTTIQQSSSRAVIDWNTFNTSTSETVEFLQPSASAIALNRVHDSGASTFDGHLLANGNVWIINPNGVLFGKNAQVNVGGLLATTSNIANNDFMAGNYNFSSPGNPNASVSNAGNVTVAQGGLAAFVAPTVVNDGVINAKLGKGVALGQAIVMPSTFTGTGLSICRHSALSQNSSWQITVLL